MNIQEIYSDKRKIIENILDNGYGDFASDIENDNNYSLNSDEIAEMYYEVILMEINHILTDYEWNRIIKQSVRN